MQTILNSLPVYMMIGIVIVVGISQLNRVVGGALGVLFWLAVGVVGSFGYDRGASLGVPGFAFPRVLFYALCLMFGALHGFTAWSAHRRKRLKELARTVDEPEDEDDA